MQTGVKKIWIEGADHYFLGRASEVAALVVEAAQLALKI